MVANVLIINDNDKKLHKLSLVLKKKFYALYTVKSFERAFKIVRKQSIDVVLLVINRHDEIKNFFPFFRALSKTVPIIGVVDDISSPLGIDVDYVVEAGASIEKIIRKIDLLSKIKNSFDPDMLLNITLPTDYVKKITLILHEDYSFLDLNIVKNANFNISDTINPNLMNSDIFIINADRPQAIKYAAIIRRANRKVPIIFTSKKIKNNLIFDALSNIDYADVFNIKTEKIPLAYEVNALIKFSKMNELCLNKIREQLYSSTVDVTTGVYNRSYLENFIKENDMSYICEAIFMIDVDKFKLINDKFGHTFADIALNGIAKIIKKCIRSSDVIARYGGDEFIIIMSDITKDAAMEVAQRIHDRVLDFKLNDASFSVSIGVYIKVGNIPTRKAIIAADNLMYAVKKSGGNGIKIDECD